VQDALKKSEKPAEEKSGGNEKLFKQSVSPDEIAEVVARWTGVPATKLLEGEKQKLLALQDELSKQVIGQEEPVRLVSEAILRSRAGVQNPRRPVGSFLFLGPTGVGKTELAKSLARQLFDSEDAMIRIDMSEYMEKHTVSRLVGAPPGYVGFEEGGQLTEAIRRKPYSVVLLDEIEKAHPDVFNILLQILDDGRLTDGQGRTVNCRNAVFILTSNIGSRFLVEGVENGEITAKAREQVMAELRAGFRPEFLNRIDDIVLFKPLGEEQISAITDLLIKALNERLSEQRICVSLDKSAHEWIAKNGYDPVYGARPLRRFIQKEIETPLAKEIIAGRVAEGQSVKFSKPKNDESGLKISVK